MRTLTAEIALEVSFHDIDPMEVVWHGHYPKYFELARTALMRTLDYDYPDMRASGYAWPVIELNIRYVKPARYGQKIIARAEIVEWENRLKINYLIRDAETGLRLTKGHSVQVALELDNGEMCFVSPPILFEKLGLA